MGQGSEGTEDAASPSGSGGKGFSLTLDPPPEQMVELVRRNLAGEFEDTKSDQDKFLRCSTFKWSRGRLTSWVVRGGGGEEVR